MGGLFDLEANSCYSSCWSLKHALVTITTVAAYAHNHDPWRQCMGGLFNESFVTDVCMCLDQLKNQIKEPTSSTPGATDVCMCLDCTQIKEPTNRL